MAKKLERNHDEDSTGLGVLIEWLGNLMEKRSMRFTWCGEQSNQLWALLGEAKNAGLV
uniref:Uncharacterized protein n=1 Tax=Cucumis melo TaxID=3656 RepID=A0A9I9DHZ4_CUCME